jgi:hypothetical protein
MIRKLFGLGPRAQQIGGRLITLTGKSGESHRTSYVDGAI